MRRRRLAITALVLAVLCAVPAVALAANVVGERSNEPAGATVNICGAGAGTLGVRVSAPYRGDELSPWVRIGVEYYSTEDGAWHAVDAGGDSGWFQAGGPGTGADTGYTFPFLAPDPGHRLLMRGVARIEWRGPGGGEATTLVTGPCEVTGDAGDAPVQPVGSG
jgi:hypothetical protein